MLCKCILLISLSKFLSNEFLPGLAKKSYKNNSEFWEIIEKQSLVHVLKFI